MSNQASAADEKAGTALRKDCAALCRLTASSLANVSNAAGVLCAACAQVCRLCEREEKEKWEAALRLKRACLHCAEECERLAAGLPPVTALA